MPGPVVRVSPNELSFGSAESWTAVYSYLTAERPTPIKAPYYEIFGAGFKSLCIGSERDPKRHSEMRKMLSPAFSQRSLLDQEHIVSQKIDDFITIIGQKAGPDSKGINMTKWFEMVSFDILGEMAFGESFHSLEDGNGTPPKPWTLVAWPWTFLTRAHTTDDNAMQGNHTFGPT
jgi:cytochrome P450